MRYQVIFEVRDGSGEVVGSTDDTYEADSPAQAVDTATARWRDVRPDCTFRELLTVEDAAAPA